MEKYTTFLLICFTFHTSLVQVDLASVSKESAEVEETDPSIFSQTTKPEEEFTLDETLNTTALDNSTSFLLIPLNETEVIISGDVKERFLPVFFVPLIPLLAPTAAATAKAALIPTAIAAVKAAAAAAAKGLVVAATSNAAKGVGAVVAGAVAGKVTEKAWDSATG